MDDGHRSVFRAVIKAWREERRSRAGPMRLSELAAHAGELADALAAAAVALAVGRGGTVSCRKGCAACCREAVPLSPPEAMRLAETLASLDGDRRAEAEEGFRRAAAALNRAGLGEAPLFHHAAEYFALGIACPFLREEACGVYASRPSACRMHLVSSPACQCGGFPNPSIRPVDMPLSVAEALSEAAAGPAGGREMIPLARLPEWMAAHADLASREWDGAALLDRLAAACLAAAADVR